MSDNYENLKFALKELKDIAAIKTKISAASTTSILFTEEERNALIQKIQGHIETGSFQKAFIPLSQLKDHYKGIRSDYRNDILIRNAIEQDTSVPISYEKAIYYSFAELGLNYLLGLRDLLHFYNPESLPIGAEQALISIAQQFFDHLIPTNPNNIDEQTQAEILAEYRFSQLIHKALTPFYKQYCNPAADDKKTHEDLQLARDFSNLYVAPYPIITLSKFKIIPGLRHDLQTFSPYLAEIEIPLTDLTEEQIQSYENRESEAWFTEQSELAQHLISQHTEAIKEGRVIPAQLIYHLIGSRNAYQKTTALYKPPQTSTQEATYTVLNTAYHAGSQAQLLKGVNKASCEEAVRQNIQQLTELIGTNTLHLNTLVSGDWSKKDNRVLQQIISAVTALRMNDSETNILLNNTPLNLARCISSNLLFESLGVILTRANEVFETHREEIQNYYDDPQSHGKPENVLILKIHECAKALYKAYTQAGTKIRDPENINLQIATHMNLLVHYLNEYSENPQLSAIVSGCFSGQDRGGVLSMNTTILAIFYELLTHVPPNADNFLELIKEQLRELQHAITMNQHTQTMASIGGGRGGDGIKSDSLYTIPASYPAPAKQHLLKRTSRFNEHLPVKLKPLYQSKALWLGVAGLLIGAGLITTGALSIQGIIMLGISIKVVYAAIAVGGTLSASSTYTLKKRIQHEKQKPSSHERYRLTATPTNTDIDRNNGEENDEFSSEEGTACLF